jgi:hypothetical protein
MSDKINKLVKLYGKITEKAKVPSDRIPMTQIPVKKREIPKPNLKLGPK